VVLLVAAFIAVAGTSARANVPFADIASSGPLTHIFVGNDLSCQIAFRGDDDFELYPPNVRPGDCGTFLAAGGRLYGPDFAAHDESAVNAEVTRWTVVSQEGVTGSGTRQSPYLVVTRAVAGASGLSVEERDSYIRGDLAYRTSVTVRNSGRASRRVVLYRAGDCFLQNSDVGYGFVALGGGVGCSRHPDNRPPGRIEEWLPISGNSHHYEAGFADVWSRISTRRRFVNGCDCGLDEDNGAGLSWSFTVPAGGTVVRRNYADFSPRGITGTPRSRDRTPPQVYIGLPRHNRCVPNGYRLRIIVLDASRLDGPITVDLDGNRVKTTTRHSFRIRLSRSNTSASRTHELIVSAVDVHGNDSERTRHFTFCGASFTG